jgi:uncharacterized protein
MDREQVIAALRTHEAELHRFGVARLYLFGSVARNEARAESDVDLFFDTDNPRFSLIELVDVQERVNAILGVESDVMTSASLHPILQHTRIGVEAPITSPARGRAGSRVPSSSTEGSSLIGHRQPFVA